MKFLALYLDLHILIVSIFEVVEGNDLQIFFSLSFDIIHDISYSFTFTNYSSI